MLRVMTTPLEDRIFHISGNDEFEAVALEVFRRQYARCHVYRQWVDLLGVRPASVGRAEEIPMLPIELFKGHRIVSFCEAPAGYFQSSGTTGMTRSRHYYSTLALYDRSLLEGFRTFWGDPNQYCFVALLPNYLHQGHSSLIHMMQLLIQESHCAEGGFYDTITPALLQLLGSHGCAGRRLLLFGVTYALLDLMERRPMDLHDAVVFETGGMKGRRPEMVKQQLHAVLQEGFHVSAIASEYGMCELFSQAYSRGQGLFEAPPWMRVSIRDVHAPLHLLSTGRSGGINVTDLANLDSCSFIATQDLGKLHAPTAMDGAHNSHGTNLFEILGRTDNSDIRGCNLMAEL